MAGAFITSRCIFDNKIWRNIVEFRMFFYIYGNAVFDEKGIHYGNININRGQYLRSIRHLQADLEYIENHAVKTYSLSTIKRAIDSLITQEKITTEQTELGTLFTVLNYEEYQRLENYKNTNLEQMENTDRTDGEQIQNNNKKDKNVKKDKKDINNNRQKFADDSIQIILSNYLKDKILSNNPRAKPPNIQSWASHIDKMLRIDNCTPDEIRSVIDFSQSNKFWMAIILSTKKLREKFDTLEMQSKTRNKAQPHIPKAYSSLENWAKQKEGENDS